MREKDYMNKELFYKSMQPCLDTGLLREVYSSDYMAIFSFGEFCYAACPYYLLNGKEPFCVFLDNRDIETFVNDNLLFYSFVKAMVRDGSLVNRGMVLSKRNLGNVSDVINDALASNKNYIDFELEEKIKNNKQERTL